MIAIEIPKLQHMSRAQSRRYSFDGPVGHYKSGAPFGQKNDPITIAISIGSISSGIAAVSAATTIGASILGGLMIAGGAFSALGSITGNKTLSTIGAVAGLAGGIGGSFVSGIDGSFINPFSSEAGQGFFNSVTGSGIKSVFDDIKGGLGITDSLTTNNAIAGNIKSAAGVPGAVADSVADAGTLLSSGTEQLKNVDGISTSVFGRAVDTAKDVGGGILSTVNNNQGMVGALGGLGDGYMKGKELEQLQPVRDAQAANLNSTSQAQQQQIDLINKRQENLQFQPNSAPTVNQSHDVHNSQPGNSNAGRYAVAINGTIKYVTQEEYDAMRATQAGTGMLSQGGV